MAKFCNFLLFCASLGLTAPTAVAADFSCDGIKPTQYQDATLLFQSGGDWQKVSRLSVLGDGPHRSRSFLFVIHDAPNKNGILVIKSGRNSTQDNRLVTMKRLQETQAQDGFKCHVRATAKYEARVSALSYDAYHDSEDGKVSEPDLAAIQNFHIDYVNARGKCIRTDDTEGDATSIFSKQSNRTQFSYDMKIVDGGLSQVALFNPFSYFISTANAQSQPLGRRVVTMISYRTDENGYACPSFSAPTGDGTFLRVLELEGRRANGNRRTEFRLKD